MSWKDYKAVTADLKNIYQSATEEDACSELDRLTENRDGQYPQISKSWRTYRSKVVTLFDYPDDIREAIYPTNAKVFASDDSALKVIYPAALSAAERRTLRVRHWKLAFNRFAIKFEQQFATHIALTHSRPTQPESRNPSSDTDDSEASS